MNKQALAAIEIEALALSTLAAPDDRPHPVSHGGGDQSFGAGDPTARGAALACRHLGSRWRRDGPGLCRRLAVPVELPRRLKCSQEETSPCAPPSKSSRLQGVHAPPAKPDKNSKFFGHAVQTPADHYNLRAFAPGPGGVETPVVSCRPQKC